MSGRLLRHCGIVGALCLLTACAANSGGKPNATSEPQTTAPAALPLDQQNISVAIAGTVSPGFLGIINERQARYLFQQISARGWRKGEPVEIPAERPRALRQMAEMLYGPSIDYRRLAEDSALPPPLLREIFEDMAVAPSGTPLETKVVNLADRVRARDAER